MRRMIVLRVRRRPVKGWLWPPTCLTLHGCSRMSVLRQVRTLRATLANALGDVRSTATSTWESCETAAALTILHHAILFNPDISCGNAEGAPTGPAGTPDLSADPQWVRSLSEDEQGLLAGEWGVPLGLPCSPEIVQSLVASGRVDVLLALEKIGLNMMSLCYDDDGDDLTGLPSRQPGNALMLDDDIHLLLAFWQMLLREWTPVECIDAADRDRHVLSGKAHIRYGTRSGRCGRTTDPSPPGVCACHGPDEHMRAFIGLALEMAADYALPSGEEFEYQARASRERSEWIEFGESVRSRRVSVADVAEFCDSILEPNVVAWRFAHACSAKMHGCERKRHGWSWTQTDTWIEGKVQVSVLRACQLFNVSTSRKNFFY